MTESEKPMEEQEQKVPVSNEDKQNNVTNEVSKNDMPQDKNEQNMDIVQFGIIVSLVVLIVSLLAAQMGKHYRRGMDIYDVWYSFLESFEEVPKSLLEDRVVGPEPGVKISLPTLKPDSPISFKVFFNGDGLSNGIPVSSEDYDSLDTVIEVACLKFIKLSNDGIIRSSMCRTANGARLYKETGVRIYSFQDISDGSDTYIVPQGVLFVYPYKEVGHVIYPETVEEAVPGKPIKLTQLSMNPRVFSIENFMSEEEMTKIIAHNEDLVKPSEVGFSGWRDSTRTSHTSWDFHSWAAKRVLRRSFDLAAMSFDKTMSDAVQVLKYGNTEWYKPHVDWFDSKGYVGHDPTVNNGTNRFATVFLYISDVDEGGETVFPLSTTHEGYNGELLVKKGTVKTPGYISAKDAAWVCNSSSTALRTKPKAGDAVLFYSQGPRGELDPNSLHGGCPVISGTKWSANVWLWNRPKPGKDRAKADDVKKREDYLKGKKSDVQSIHVEMANNFGKTIELYWDDGSDNMILQNTIDNEESSPMTTYHGHIFRAIDPDTGKILGSYRADPKDNHKVVYFSRENL